MTNQEILSNEIIANKLMSREELQNYININLKLPDYLTFYEWNKRGYKIKKGEKAAIKTKLWIKTKKKQKDNNNQTDDNIDEESFILVNANLFGQSQVEKTTVVD